MVTYKSKKFWLLSSSCKLSLPISDVTFTICTATRTFREKKTTTTSKQSQKKKQGKRSQARKCFWRKFDCIFCIKLLTSKFHVLFVQNKGNEINKCAARAKPVCSSVLLIKLVIFCRSSHRRRLAYTILLLILFFAHTNESFAFTPT